jgi:hypothetical protein
LLPQSPLVSLAAERRITQLMARWKGVPVILPLVSVIPAELRMFKATQTF